MRRIFIVFFTAAVVILCSWVDPDTIDVYSGTAVKTDYTYETTNLSGSVQYYLTTYDGICLDDSGHLYNSSGSNISGRILTSYGEFSCRVSSLGGMQIYQEYVTGTSVRSTWVSYDVTPDELPSDTGMDPVVAYFSTLAVLILVFVVVRFFV